MSSTHERLSMPPDIRANTAPMIATPFRSCDPPLQYGLNDSRNCSGLFRVKLPGAGSGVFGEGE